MSLLPPAPEELVDALRHRVRRHNGEVLGYAGLTAVGAIGLWLVVYAFVYWVLLLFLASIDFPSANPLPHYRAGFLLVAAGLVALAWLLRRLNPDDRPPDRKPVVKLILEVLLALPRMTLAIWGNLSAWLWLSPEDLAAAANLLARVIPARRIPFHEAPQEIPELETRERVLQALLLLDLIGIRQEDQIIWIFANPAEKPPFITSRVAAPPGNFAPASTPPRRMGLPRGD